MFFSRTAGGGLGLAGFQVSRVTFLLASCEPDLVPTHPPGSVGYGLIEMVLVCNYGNSSCLIKVRLAVQPPVSSVRESTVKLNKSKLKKYFSILVENEEIDDVVFGMYSLYV